MELDVCTRLLELRLALSFLPPFLVYEVWPGGWIEKSKGLDKPADVGKVLGGFLSSAFVHGSANLTVHKSNIEAAFGEAEFFTGCEIVVILEELGKRFVMNYRQGRTANGKGFTGHGLERLNDGDVGKIWWSSALLYVSRNLARGWYVSFRGVSLRFEESLAIMYVLRVQVTFSTCLSISSIDHAKELKIEQGRCWAGQKNGRPLREKLEDHRTAYYVAGKKYHAKVSPTKNMGRTCVSCSVRLGFLANTACHEILVTFTFTHSYPMAWHDVTQSLHPNNCLPHEVHYY